MAISSTKGLDISAADSSYRISFYVESSTKEGREFSITVGGADESWGEFFSKEDAAILYLWLGKRLEAMA